MSELLEGNAMAQAGRRQRFSEALQRLCLITVEDAGMSDADVDNYIGDAQSAQDYQQAAIAYADDYDLDVVGRGWFGI
ncbi:hypothetical protein [Rhodanobacter denitrificans]|uniref:Uncharacterized protein n=1 Tax=Rhodanobacter denitrificans TaxID=666685 RepID=M4NE70_9GAMM|nr:hypothetical protein [Rhodanobacter denitrificans]AGG89024.1 hypothetical protein R2APBS1_1900 [Rhodanobacter denitrificans]UJJ53053.1 hypothetical protein LRK52_18265 [Rhodanobacter denitrificans]